MNFKDINDKWKEFLSENTFKEDIIIKDKDKKKRKKKNKKEIIVSEKDNVDEWEELEETSVMSGGAIAGAPKALDDEE
jgi:hypothetical protein